MGVRDFPAKEAVCVRCGATFVKDHPRRKICSPACRKANDIEVAREWSLRNRDKIYAARKRRYRANPDPFIERARDYGQSERGKAVQRARSAIRRVTERDKIAARNALNAAVKAGRITRGVCRDCGSPNTHGHHPDYTKPLEVIWLCPTHHLAEHRRIDTDG